LDHSLESAQREAVDVGAGCESTRIDELRDIFKSEAIAASILDEAQSRKPFGEAQ
jgi:hypothetical protein